MVSGSETNEVATHGGEGQVSEFKAYSVAEILAMDIKFDWLIEKFIRVGDVFLIKAQKKIGKGVLAQQLAFALSSGQAFLNSFHVLKPCKVCYISGEGYMGDWQKRFNDMKRLWTCNDDNIRFVDGIKYKLHKEEGEKGANELLRNLKSLKVDFDVFIFDPLYKLCSGGNFNDNVEMGEFFNNVEMITKAFSASAIVVHHDSEKIYTDNRGFKHSSASTKNAMGASAITMAVTHYATLTTYKNDKRKLIHKLEMGDSRSSEYLPDIEMFMITPEKDKLSRLGYTTDEDDISVNYHTIKSYVQSNGKLDSSGSPFEALNMASATFYYNMRKLLSRGFIRRETDDNNKNWYLWKGEEDEEK